MLFIAQLSWFYGLLCGKQEDKEYGEFGRQFKLKEGEIKDSEEERKAEASALKELQVLSNAETADASLSEMLASEVQQAETALASGNSVTAEQITGQVAQAMAVNVTIVRL